MKTTVIQTNALDGWSHLKVGSRYQVSSTGVFIIGSMYLQEDAYDNPSKAVNMQLPAM